MDERPLVNWTVCHGTLHLAFVGSARAIVCSDSRGSFDSDDAPPKVSFRKLFQVGPQYVCGISGILNLGPSDYIEHRLDRLCAEPKLQERPAEFLSVLADEIEPRLRQALSEVQPTHAFNAFTLARNDSGRFSVSELTLPIIGEAVKKLGKREIVNYPDPKPQPGADAIFVFGDRTCVKSGIFPKSLNTQTTDRLFLEGIDLLFSSIRASDPECGRAIGGPIDISCIDSHGARWMRLKPPQQF